MRALVKTVRGRGLSMLDMDEPPCGPGDIKVRVLRSGLCGTDIHLLDWDEWAASTVTPPLIIGHEFYGLVAEVGADVQSIAVGQAVSGEGHIVCGFCRNCRAGRRHLCINTASIGVNRDGAFADYLVIPVTNAWVQPDSMDPDIGALFDPFGNATHTALSFPMAGEDVVVTGAGPIGIMAIAITRHVGARYIVNTDPSAARRALAIAAGADLAIDPRDQSLTDAMRSLGLREGFDVGLEMSGAPTAVESMLSSMNHGGKIALLGLPHGGYDIDWGRVITHMLTIKGIYGREMYDTWYAMSSMLQSSGHLREALRSVVTHRFPADQWVRAFQTVKSGRCGKVLLDWS